MKIVSAKQFANRLARLDKRHCNCTAGAIDVSTIYIDARNKQKAEDRKSSFSYLYHAQRKGIVNRFS